MIPQKQCDTVSITYINLYFVRHITLSQKTLTEHQKLLGVKDYDHIHFLLKTMSRQYDRSSIIYVLSKIACLNKKFYVLRKFCREC